MREYPKIYGPYRRHTEGPHRNKLIPGEWTRPEFAYLADNEWLFTEKVDGTNIRVHWDGHRTTYGGRTDTAQIPAKLINWVDATLPEELFEQAFGAETVTLFGEGFGAGIQSGGKYLPEQQLVLFDVLVGQWWLRRADVEDVASKLGLESVPLTFVGTLHAAMKLVADGVRSAWGDFTAEGLVGVTAAGLLDRNGDRLMVKVKAKDMQQLAPTEEN